MNKEQVEGLAKVFDNLGIAAILGTAGAFVALKDPAWEVALLGVGGVGSIYAGYCWRKLLSSVSQSSQAIQAGPPVSAPSLPLSSPSPLSSVSMPVEPIKEMEADRRV